MITPPDKTTIVGTLLGVGSGYASYKEIAAMQLHPIYDGVLAGFVVLSVVLILADDAQALSALTAVANLIKPFWPWGNK